MGAAGQAPGNGQGARYEWQDTTVTVGTTYYYWLESVSITGTTERYGPVSATAPLPTAIAVNTFTARPLLLSETTWLVLGILLAVGVVGGLGYMGRAGPRKRRV